MLHNIAISEDSIIVQHCTILRYATSAPRPPPGRRGRSGEGADEALEGVQLRVVELLDGVLREGRVGGSNKRNIKFVVSTVFIFQGHKS